MDEPDHDLALRALNIVRAEMAKMTYPAADGGVRDNGQVAGKMLDTIESLIEHHIRWRHRSVTDE